MTGNELLNFGELDVLLVRYGITFTQTISLVRPESLYERHTQAVFVPISDFLGRVGHVGRDIVDRIFLFSAHGLVSVVVSASQPIALAGYDSSGYRHLVLYDAVHPPLHTLLALSALGVLADQYRVCLLHPVLRQLYEPLLT